MSLQVLQGADFDLSVNIVNRSNSAIDLTGCVVRAMLKGRVSDSDSDALVSLHSASHSSYFNVSDAENGNIVVTIGGNLTATLGESDGKPMRTYAQVEASLGGRYYRTPNIQIDLLESVIKS